MAVADKVGDKIKTTYAQKKVSLWESGQLIPTPDEMNAISILLGLALKDLKDSFSGILAYSTADFIRGLARSPNPVLIAGCFAGRVRSQLLEEDEDALREALNKNVSLAMFFPFTLEYATAARADYAEGLSGNHRSTWRSLVRFLKILRTFGEAASHRVKLYRPALTSGANVLFAPIFHRPTLLCERANGRTKVQLYSWTQGSEYDGFYGIGGRTLEDSEVQAEAWQLYFGRVFDQWGETGELIDTDTYWRAYSGDTDDEFR
jgi:hypothetical protein